jgi:SAM-dependent methyltransferase
MPMMSTLKEVRELLHRAAPRTTLGIAPPGEVRRVQALLQEATHKIAALERGMVKPLDEYRREIDRFNASQPNTELLDAIRNYNHVIVGELNKIAPVAGKTVLDVGASPHGYALEHALTLGVASYVGIGLDVEAPLVVSGPNGLGELRNADAESLPFDDRSFDVIVSMSTFEHVAHVDRVLTEMHRVLRPGGRVLVTFEPIWTCAYGHHLHHFGPVASCVPDWSHLIWTKDQMAAALAPVWPANDPTLTLDGAVSWVYDSHAINRIGIRQMRERFEHSPLKVDFFHSMPDVPRDPDRLAEVSRTVGLTADELMTKGLTVVLHRAS